jgi:tellurite resistance protein
VTQPGVSGASPAGPRVVDYHALRFLRDEHFLGQIQPRLEEAKREDVKLEQKLENEEEKFFQFLSHAVDIRNVGPLPRIIDQVNANLGNSLPLQVFLTEFPTATAMCIPRLSIQERAEVNELIILLSQHFMNELDDDERASILGHELGHALLGHSTVPRQPIFDGSIEIQDLPELRVLTLRWSVCSEVSCDLFGYVASGGNARACQTALLKFTTGLGRSTFAALDPSAVIGQVLGQYDVLASSVVKNVISTHPLTPLRVKLLERLDGLSLFRHFGRELPAAELASLRRELNDALNPLVRAIYPELYEEEQLDQGFILFYLAVATGMSDGVLDRNEINAMNKMIRPDLQTEPFFSGLEDAMRERDIASIVDELVERAVAEAKEKGYGKEEATRVAKLMLVIAAADGKVDSKELRTIYQFGRNFRLTKREIVYLANQVNTPPA